MNDLSEEKTLELMEKMYCSYGKKYENYWNELKGKVMNWIKVGDRLPPKDTEVLVAIWDGRKNVNMFFVAIGRRFKPHEWVIGDDEEIRDHKYGTVTHWMPLPDPPPVSNKETG